MAKLRASRPLLLLLSTSLCCLPLTPCQGDALDNWETVRNWSVRPVCVPIPRNMTLCRDIGYSQLRLPNLLRHDSVSEIMQQAATWTPLLNLRCDPDTQLFLCSLYAPICLERHIYPCRSLCQKVESNCGARMLKWGFPWPDVVRCDQFPKDNDMCIKAQSRAQASANPVQEGCEVCSQPETKENIMDHYCRADVVVTAKFRRIKSGRAQCGKARIFKPQSAPRAERRALRKPTLVWRLGPECCPRVRPRDGKFLIMATRGGQDQLIPTLVLPWRNSRLFRSLRPMLKRFNCSDSRVIHEQVLPPITTVKRRHRPRGIKRGRVTGGGHPRRNRRRKQNRRKLTTTTESTSTEGDATDSGGDTVIE